MDLIGLLNTDDLALSIIRYLGHHGTVTLCHSCKCLQQILLLDDSGKRCWKDLALKTLLQYFKDDTKLDLSTMHQNNSLNWRSVSHLLHSNLRRRRVLASLGLPLTYRFNSPSKRFRLETIDLNQNKNLCLLMGNNGTENFMDWIHLPVRHSDTLATDEWATDELQLLSKAGHHGMHRLGKEVKTIVETIQNETLGLPLLARSGSLKSLDPKLRVAGNGCALRVPLNPDVLSSIIQDKHSNCQKSTYGQDGRRRFDKGIRSSWKLDLGTDVEVTDKVFQAYLRGPPLNNDEPGMWSGIRDLGMVAANRLALGGDSTTRFTAKPCQMLIYGKNGRFKPHRDGQHSPGHFGTLVIVLPVATKEGEETIEPQGELVIRCQKDEDENIVEVQTHHPPRPSESASWHIFTIGTAHEVTPVKSGYRVALVYQLWLEGGSGLNIPRSPNLNILTLLGHSIQHWLVSNAMEELVEFILPLRNNYGLKEFQQINLFDDEHLGETKDQALKDYKLVGSDAWLYRGLLDAFSKTDMKLELEYNEVALNVPGYPQGLVRRSLYDDPIPLEDQCKIVWLHDERQGEAQGQPLIDCEVKTDKAQHDKILVATICIHHKAFRCRGTKRIGRRRDNSREAGWTHPDDEGDDSDGDSDLED